MEIADLAKKIEWLEREHRKDHAAIAELQEKLTGSEGSSSLLQNQITELTAELARYKATGVRLDQFDRMVTQYRAEVSKSIDEMEKRRLKHDRDTDERRRMEVDVLNKGLIEVRASVDALQDLRRGLQLRMEEDMRLARVQGEFEKKLAETVLADDEIRRSVRSVDEARKNDIKRISDMQGDLSAVRKRAEDARERSELNSDSLRQLDTRINELLSSESDRRQGQILFIEQQSLSQVERERGWKDIQIRFEAFIKQNVNIDQQLASLEETQRSVKRSQENFDEMNVRIERRINEITEIQRLTEERFRQEWVTLKADDQKRWTNYTLAQDDWVKEIRADQEKLSQRIATLDDDYQSLQDLVQQTSETTETQLQELMNWAHEFLTSYGRIMGRPKPSR